MESGSPDLACSKNCTDPRLVVDDLSHFKQIVEAITSCVYIFQGDKICYVNPYTESFTGYSKGELQSMSFWDFVHPDDQEMIKQRGRAWQNGAHVLDNYDFKIVRKNGDALWVNWRVNVIELGGKAAVAGVIDDIIECKQTEGMLNDNKKMYQSVVEQVSDGIAIVQDGKDVYVNPAVTKMWGKPAEDIVGRHFLDIIHPDEHERLAEIYKRRMAGSGSMASYEVRCRNANGDTIWVEMTGSLIQFEGKSADLVSVRDITERKKAEQSLCESEKKYRGMVMNLMEGFYRVTLDGKLQDYNVEFTKILGLDPNKDYTGTTLPDFWQNPEDRKDYTREIKTHGFIKNYTVQAKKVDGEKIAVMVNARLIKGENSNPLLIEGSFLDITERKRAEGALLDSRTKLAEAQRIGHMGNWEFDLIQDTGQFSDETYHIFGVAADYGESFKSFFRRVHPDDRRLVKQANQKAFKTGGFSNVQYRIIRLDGSVRFVQASGECYRDESGKPCRIFGTIQDVTDRKLANELVYKLSQAVDQAGGSIMITNKAGIIEYVNPAFTKITGYSAEDAIGQSPRLFKSGDQDGAFYEHMWKTIIGGGIWHGKVIDKRKDGSFFPAMLTIAPIVNNKGEISHFVGSHADIGELEDMEKQFHQAQKMEAIGTLVGGIAHDFNNMLAGITGNIYLARKQVQAQPDVLQKLTNVEQISMRAAEMIQQLLTFSRKGTISIKEMSFTSFIKGTLKLLCMSASENIAIHQDICADVLQINGDSTQLQQALMNLVNNARDAIDGIENPNITIRLEAFHADRAFVKKRTYFNTSSYAHLSVEDNGCGIPKEQLKHLFEPFFTTKEQGKGTGLGLAMVFGVVKTHHGFIEVDSIPGQGSTFHIYLPLLKQEELDSELPQDRVLAGHGRGETILLADDQEVVLGIGKEVLETLGYKVLPASNGQQAVEIFEAHAEDIDLCIFDIIMPVMDGSQAARCIRQIKPQAKIIFSTGYDKLTQNNMEHETVINKPFSIEKMSRLIRQKLDDVAHELG